jgi:competence protein ComEA
MGAIALLGIGAQVERARRPAPPPTAEERAALQRQIARVDSARSAKKVPRGRSRRSAMDSSSGRVAALAIVDLDVATEAEIEGLPRIGPVLARRIVANRDSLGPFGSMEEFQRVRGVGPSMAAQLAPHVTFSLKPRPGRQSLEKAKRPPSRRGTGGKPIRA